MNEIFNALGWGFCCGLVATVYRGVLAYEPYFTKWWAFGARFEGRWFFKPVWSCSHCTGGQLAAWSFLILRIVPPAINAMRQILSRPELWAHYTARGLTVLFCLIIAISAAIFTAKVLTWFLENKIK